MPRKVQTILLVMLVAVFAVLALSAAWVSDDAYITFRSVENFLAGYGPVYNVGERVQTFTHPLWFALLSLLAAVLRPLGVGLPLISIGLSLVAAVLAAQVLAFRIARGPVAAGGALLLLGLCKALVDYSTSGLEDALTFLLLALFWARFFQVEGQGRLAEPGAITLLALLAALAGLNRLDTLLFYLPVLAWVVFSHPGSGWARFAKPAGLVLVGMLPLIVWELFSIFYYGFPFPNTAYAKLNTGIPRGLLLAQGARYALDALRRDPLVWVVLLGALASVLPRGSSAGRRLLAAGMSAYGLYVVWIGGDFMAGRFWAAPVFAGVVALASAEKTVLPEVGRGDAIPPGLVRPQRSILWPRWVHPALAAAGVGALAILIAGANPWRTLPPQEARVLPESGIVDERSWYFPQMGLASMLVRGQGFPGRPAGAWVYDPERAEVLELDTIGVDGYRAGPSVYVLDRWALADPLLARLPVEDPRHWRIGHFRRRLPEGYLETLQTGRNVILNPGLALFYDQIRQVTRGPLASPGRLAQAVRLLAWGGVYR